MRLALSIVVLLRLRSSQPPMGLHLVDHQTTFITITPTTTVAILRTTPLLSSPAALEGFQLVEEMAARMVVLPLLTSPLLKQ
jgi:hypothetical protein